MKKISEWTDEETKILKSKMILKYGKTSFENLAKELGISRQTVCKVIRNMPYTEHQRKRIREWIENN